MTNRGRYVLIAVLALPAVFVAASRMRTDVVHAPTTSAEPEGFGLVLSGTDQAIGPLRARDQIARSPGSRSSASTDSRISILPGGELQVTA